MYYLSWQQTDNIGPDQNANTEDDMYSCDTIQLMHWKHFKHIAAYLSDNNSETAAGLEINSPYISYSHLAYFPPIPVLPIPISPTLKKGIFQYNSSTVTWN